MKRESEKGDDGGVSEDLKSCGKDMGMKQMTTLTDKDHPSTYHHSVSLSDNREVCSVCVSVEEAMPGLLRAKAEALSCKKTC